MTDQKSKELSKLQETDPKIKCNIVSKRFKETPITLMSFFPVHFSPTVCSTNSNYFCKSKLCQIVPWAACLLQIPLRMGGRPSTHLLAAGIVPGRHGDSMGLILLVSLVLVGSCMFSNV